jgi:uracil-DNA glycosylase
MAEIIEKNLNSEKKDMSNKKKRVNNNKDIIEENFQEKDSTIIEKDVKAEKKKNGIKDYFTVNSKTSSTKINTNKSVDLNNIIEIETNKELIVSNNKLEKKQDNIIQENKNKKTTGLDSFIQDLGSWEEPLKEFIHGDKMKSIYKYVENAYSQDTCYPPKDEIFNAFKKTPWENLKVVIIGQDPYFNKGEAMGLCFSVNKGIKVPPSLKNIYKAMVGESIIKSIPNHGDLSSWADQGVLMLNATLTVKAGEANSHQKGSGWESFTDHVIKVIDSKKKGVVFILWGAFAQKKAKLLKSGNSKIIQNIHPSPLAASKGDFNAIKQFTLANEYLTNSGMKIIDWKII